MNNKYGFEENFNGSSISDQSQDIIIVEPLDEEQQVFNKANALYLTGMHPVTKSNQQSLYQNTSQYKPIQHSYIPFQQESKQSQRPVYNPNQTVQRSNFPSQQQQHSKQIQESQQQQLQQRKPVDIAPRVTTSVMKPLPDKPTHQPSIQTPPMRVMEVGYKSDEEEEEDNNNKIIERVSIKQPSVPELPKQPIIQTQNRITVSKEPKQPVLSLQEKQQQMNMAKQQLINFEQQSSKLIKQQYQGGEMVELITNQKGLIKVNPELNALFSNDRNSIVMVGILGQSKSGKSSLLNEISHLKTKQKFNNSGVWICTKPLVIEQKSYYFIDCTTDNQLIYAFVMLVCSTLLYNTIKLDDNSIKCFAVLETLTRQFGNEQAISQILSNLIWVQRDQMQPRSINELQEFLLKAQKGQMFENLFRNRDVANIAAQGTSEYQILIQQLRDRIIFGGVCKQIVGFNFNGPLMYLYMDHMCELLNQPKTLQIEQIWLHITEEYTKHIYNISLGEYVSKISDWIKDAEQLDEKKLYFKFRDLKDKSVQQIYPLCYLNNKNRLYQVYKKKLLEVLTNKEQQAIQYCSLTSQIENETIIKKMFDKIPLKDVQSFTQSFNNLLDQLGQQRLQFQQCTVFTEIMQQIYKKLIEDLFSGYSKSAGAEDQSFQIQKTKQAVLNSQDELDKKKSDVVLQEKRKNQAIKEIQDLQEKIQLERESVIPGNNKQNDQQLDEQIYKLKQEKASNTKEINLLKKQYIEMQKRKQEESGCLIY